MTFVLEHSIGTGGVGAIFRMASPRHVIHGHAPPPFNTANHVAVYYPASTFRHAFLLMSISSGDIRREEEEEEGGGLDSTDGTNEKQSSTISRKSFSFFFKEIRNVFFFLP